MTTSKSNKLGYIAIFILLIIFISGIFYIWQYRHAPVLHSSPSSVDKAVSPVIPHYVGAASCQSCHSKEFNTWQGSHHAKAMQEANEKTVLGDFNNATFTQHGITSTFFKKDGRFFVNTEGADGKLADFAIQYTFGITPLQQYLILFPNGRYQALNIAWNSEAKQWFSLNSEKIAANDAMHWTGRYQNWNMQCAECHSTHLKKGYDASNDSYKTTFSEINVACEACHGAASEHLTWAKQKTDSANKGFAMSLKTDWQTAITERTKADKGMNACWSCHARRSTLTEEHSANAPLENSHKPALLTEPAYHADGQQREEDYTWASFRQSKMYAQGVTCMDCHEPHGLKLRAEGNAVCTRCHSASEFDTAKHHHHKENSTGAACVNCHAPEQNYMVVDGRHDHSFRLPRPDLSETLNSPNACTQCHDKQTNQWAAESLDKWFGQSWRERPHYGTVLHSGTTQGLKALPSLLELAQNQNQPAVVRATAIQLMQPLMRPEFLQQAASLLQDTDPSVRIAALGTLEPFEPSVRAELITPLLTDSVLGVRIEAARLLADVPSDKTQTALQEYKNSLQLNADWASEAINLGNLELKLGNIENAIVAFKRALTLDPRFAPAYVNLADVYRQQGWDTEGEKLLREGLVLLPDSADLHHALGLLLIRKADLNHALNELEKAYTLAKNNPHYGYVYAVALHSNGQSKLALSVLNEADKQNPYNLDILSALVSIQRETGNNKAALANAKKALELLPNDAAIKQSVTELETQ